jgi:thymidylate synthase
LPKGVDQIEKVIDDLKRDITSKGAQATTWMPTADPGLESNRPCLQRLWFRPLPLDENEESKGYLLNMNSHWRSRDLAKAWFMNVYAITDWQRDIAQRLEKRIGKPVKVGSYTDISDSLHIYGAYFNETKVEFEKMRNQNMEKRVWDSYHPAFTMMTQETRQKLSEDVDFQKKTRSV